MSKEFPPREEGILDRRMVYCPTLLEGYDTKELILCCPVCLRFLARCCPHNDSSPMCHRYSLVFTDGSCLGNGKAEAAAGIGLAMGEVGVGVDQYSIPIDNTIDPHPKRTSQRAELLAAIEGLHRISTAEEPTHVVSGHPDEELEHARVVVTDSEYVVKGMTEWIPVWKACFPSNS